jgi:hypothetical protein
MRWSMPANWSSAFNQKLPPASLKNSTSLSISSKSCHQSAS